MIHRPSGMPKNAPIQEPKPMVILTSPAPMPPMAYIGNNRPQASRVPARAEPRPPSPPKGTSSKLLSRPSSQPLRIRGKVSLLGTLNFHQSITAAAILPTQMKRTGQCESAHSDHIGDIPFSALFRVRGVRVERKRCRDPFARRALWVLRTKGSRHLFRSTNTRVT